MSNHQISRLFRVCYPVCRMVKKAHLYMSRIFALQFSVESPNTDIFIVQKAPYSSNTRHKMICLLLDVYIQTNMAVYAYIHPVHLEVI